MNQRLLREIIKQVLLTEAPIDAWKAKNRSLPNEQLSQAEKYFTDLTGKYIASLHPTAKDLASLSFEQLETLYKTVETSKNKNLKSEYVKWITGQLKQLPDLSLQQVIEDYIPPLLSVQKNKEKFEPNFLENLQSIEELNKALNQKASSVDLAATVPEAHLGKIAEENGWELYMPHTTEASCEIGKTGGRRDTTWCTTRPDASNMFLQYSARADENIILFSVVKKGVNAEKDTHAKMSVGFIDGKPEFNQGDGGVSVNADNKNLTQKKFEQVLGKDLASKFLQIMQEKAGSLNGEHPAKDELRKLVQNPKAFQAKIDGFAKDDNGREQRSNFIENALGYREISPEVFTILARDKDNDVLISVAQHPNTPREALTALIKGKNTDVIWVVAGNENTPPETLAALAGYGNTAIRIAVAQNPKTPPEALDVLAMEEDIEILEAVAENPNTSPETLTALAKSKNQTVRWKVAQNPHTLPPTLTALAGDRNISVRERVAGNPNTLPETLTALAALTGAEDTYVVRAAARNPNTPLQTLTALAALTGKEYIGVRNEAKKTLEALKSKPLVEAIIMEKVWRKLLRAI